MLWVALPFFVVVGFRFFNPDQPDEPQTVPKGKYEPERDTRKPKMEQKG